MLLESTTWTWACDELNKNKTAPSAPRVTLPFDITGKDAVTALAQSPTCYQFERLAFDTLRFAFEVAAQQGSLSLTSAHLLAQFAPWFPAEFVGQSTGDNSNAAGKRQDQLVAAVYSDTPKTHFHPFDGCSTHASAYAGELSADFAKQFDDARHGKHALWYCCGGSAPIDFLLLYPVSLSKDEEVWRLWMCDARHKENPSTPTANWWPEMHEKAKQMHEALAEKLAALAKRDAEGEKHRPVKLVLHKQWQLRLITNARNPPSPPAQSWPGQIAIIDRSSFKLEPWTAMLFDDFTTPPTDRLTA